VRIGYFSPTYPRVTGDGGIGTYIRALAESLIVKGHNAHVITTGASDAATVANGVPVRVVRRRYVPLVDRLLPGASASWRIGRTALELAKSERLDVVEFPNWEGLGVWFGLRRRVPLVVRLSTSSAETQAIDGLERSWTLDSDVAREKMQARLADALVTHSYAHRRTMAAELGMEESRISVVPLGVPVFSEFRRAEPLPGEQKVVFLGRLEKRKGVVDLLNAVPRVLAEMPNTRFVLIGPDRPHAPGERLHQAYFREEFDPRVVERVTFAGALNDEAVTEHLQTADVFVAPSLYESFGLIFIEAMRWGTPVIGTKVGGIPEIVSDMETGLLVDPGSPQGLSEGIIALLKDPERRRALGDAGRRHVEAHFSVDKMAANALTLYQDVVNVRDRK
jgi:glycogen synthase